VHDVGREGLRGTFGPTLTRSATLARVIRVVATALVVAVVMAGARLGTTSSANAATLAFAPCHGTSGVLCTSVSVPLDRSGVVPGAVQLAVEELPAKTAPRGVMMLVAGGPGQASAAAFDLADYGSLWQSLFPGYTLVAFDPRGTGGSGYLGCSLGSDPLALAAQVAACAQSLGPERAFYTTAANAEDVDAVRQALGVDKVALWGTSYGTKVELAYALAHPDHVERLLLDSVVTAAGPDPLGLDTLQGIPRGLSALCGGVACRRIDPRLAAEVATLANRAALTPIRGTVRTASGQRRSVSLDGTTLLGIVVSADLNPGLQAELPSVVAGATAGRPQALLRLAALGQPGFAFAAADTSFSEGLFLATMCNDGHFPWAPDSDPAARQQAVSAAVSTLPAGSTGPFGSWATAIGPAGYCSAWPAPTGYAPIAAGPLPDVPVLALSGTLDMRTPTANAASVVAQFPEGHLLVVPGVGHSVLTTDPSGCTANAVRAWLNGLAVPTRCAATRPYIADVPRIPVSIAKAPPAPRTSGLRGRTLSVVETTVQDAFAAEESTGAAVGGLTVGAVYGNLGSITLSGYGDVPGVTVSGELGLKSSKQGAVVVPTGSVTVSGPRAAHGEITFTTTGVKAVWSRTGRARRRR
jgi:pimeloyl-ACP methyl ester carboxylesterase